MLFRRIPPLVFSVRGVVSLVTCYGVQIISPIFLTFFRGNNYL